MNKWVVRLTAILTVLLLSGSGVCTVRAATQTRIPVVASAHAEHGNSYCDQFPLDDACKGTREYCDKFPLDDSCKGSYEYCDKFPLDDSCKGSSEYCDKFPLDDSCKGSYEYCDKFPLDDSCKPRR